MLNQALSTLLAELLAGAPPDVCWVLNPNDPGLLRSLDRLSAAAASATPPSGGASIAAHADHLRYGFSLMNRYTRGERNVFAAADYSASWTRQSVTEEQWAARREELRTEVAEWQRTVREVENVNAMELTGIIASIVHLAYHLGAIRQIDRSIAGPRASD